MFPATPDKPKPHHGCLHAVLVKALWGFDYFVVKLLWFLMDLCSWYSSWIHPKWKTSNRTLKWPKQHSTASWEPSQCFRKSLHLSTASEAHTQKDINSFVTRFPSVRGVRWTCPQTHFLLSKISKISPHPLCLLPLSVVSFQKCNKNKLSISPLWCTWRFAASTTRSAGWFYINEQSQRLIQRWLWVIWPAKSLKLMFLLFSCVNLSCQRPMSTLSKQQIKVREFFLISTILCLMFITQLLGSRFHARTF